MPTMPHTAPRLRGLRTYLRCIRVIKLHEDAARHVADPAKRAEHRLLAQRFRDEATVARARLTDAGRDKADEIINQRQALRAAKAVAREATTFTFVRTA